MLALCRIYIYIKIGVHLTSQQPGQVGEADVESNIEHTKFSGLNAE